MDLVPIFWSQQGGQIQRNFLNTLIITANDEISHHRCHNCLHPHHTIDQTYG